MVEGEGESARQGLGQVEPPLPAERGAPLAKSHRRRLRFWLIIPAVVIVVLIGAAFTTAEYTSRSAFCVTCHEMDPYYASWQDSVHNQAECRDCHIPHGVIAFIETKLFSFREIYVHLTKTSTAPLAVTREIPNSNCTSCHPDPGDVTLGDVPFSHDLHDSQGCIDCHVRLVHRTVNPPYYVSPGEMSSCLACHDGTTAASQCSLCHTPPHEARGECSSCHSQGSWAASASKHPFPFEGAHASLACTDCHVSRPGVENIPGTELPQADPACVSCHGDPHGGLTDCANCHTPEGWTPAGFNHPEVGEHIPSGEHPLDCASCHPSGFASHSCTPCHEGTPEDD